MGLFRTVCLATVVDEEWSSVLRARDMGFAFRRIASPWSGRPLVLLVLADSWREILLSTTPEQIFDQWRAMGAFETFRSLEKIFLRKLPSPFALGCCSSTYLDDRPSYFFDRQFSTVCFAEPEINGRCLLTHC